MLETSYYARLQKHKNKYNILSFADFTDYDSLEWACVPGRVHMQLFVMAGGVVMTKIE